MTDYKAQHIVREPDAAREVAVNLLRHRRAFVMEIDARAVKDMVCFAVGGDLRQDTAKFHYVRMVAQSRDEATHFILGCIRGELTVAVTPHYGGDPDRWLCLTQRPRLFDDVKLGANDGVTYAAAKD